MVDGKNALLLLFLLHVFLSSEEIKVFDAKIQVFFPYTKRFKVQKTVSVQTANCSKSFKRFQMMNKGLVKRNERSLKQKQSLTFISSNARLALFCDEHNSKFTFIII